MNKIAIITGASRGIGLALAEKFHQENYLVFDLSRTKSKENFAKHISTDLSEIKNISKSFTTVFESIRIAEIKEVILINNAGTLGEINSLENISTESIVESLQVNTIAPTVLSSLFIKTLKNSTAQKTIINISSGAASSPYHGWSIYCSAKAQLDMLTRVIAEEQKTLAHGLICFGIRPGIVNTKMQSEIRNTPKEAFPTVDKFSELFEKGNLALPKTVADKIFKLYRQKQIAGGEIIDLRN